MLIIVLFLGAIVLIVEFVPKDTRTANEILQAKYISCIKANRPDSMEWCAGYLRAIN